MANLRCCEVGADNHHGLWLERTVTASRPAVTRIAILPATVAAAPTSNVFYREKIDKALTHEMKQCLQVRHAILRHENVYDCHPKLVASC